MDTKKKRNSKKRTTKFYGYGITFGVADMTKAAVNFRITTWIKPEYETSNGDNAVEVMEKAMISLVDRLIDESQLYYNKRIVILEVSPFGIRKGERTFFDLRVFLKQREMLPFDEAYDEAIPHIFRLCDGISATLKGTFSRFSSRLENEEEIEKKKPRLILKFKDVI